MDIMKRNDHLRENIIKQNIFPAITIFEFMIVFYEESNKCIFYINCKTIPFVFYVLFYTIALKLEIWNKYISLYILRKTSNINTSFKLLIS